MPPTARDFFVILFDANVSAKSEAISTLYKICLLKQNTSPKDQAKVFFMNVSETNNHKDYKGICRMDSESYKPIVVLDNLKQYKPGECDWLEALDLAVDCLSEVSETPGVITLQLLFITDFVNCKMSVNDKLSKKIIKIINKHSIFLYIVGPNVRPHTPILCWKDVTEWKNNIILKKEDENLLEAKCIIEKTKYSIMADFDIGLHLFFSYKFGKGMQPWLEPLSVFNLLKFPTSTVRVLKHEVAFKPVSRYIDPDAAKPVWATIEIPSTTFHAQDLISGVIFHDTFVKIDSDDRFKIQGPRSFSLVGFTDKRRIPEYFMQSEATYIVMPDARDPDHPAIEPFELLVEQSAKQDKYGIAKRVYASNNTPKYMVLIPRPDQTPKCFLMVELPYADDFDGSFENRYAEEILEEKTEKEITQLLGQEVKKLANEDTGNEPTDEEVFDFLDSINVNKPDTRVCDIALGPSMMYEDFCLNLAWQVEDKRSCDIAGWDPKKPTLDCLNPVQNEKADKLIAKFPQYKVIKKPEANMEDLIFEFDNMTGPFPFSS